MSSLETETRVITALYEIYTAAAEKRPMKIQQFLGISRRAIAEGQLSPIKVAPHVKTALEMQPGNDVIELAVKKEIFGRYVEFLKGILGQNEASASVIAHSVMIIAQAMPEAQRKEAAGTVINILAQAARQGGQNPKIIFAGMMNAVSFLIPAGQEIDTLRQIAGFWQSALNQSIISVEEARNFLARLPQPKPDKDLRHLGPS